MAQQRFHRALPVALFFACCASVGTAQSPEAQKTLQQEKPIGATEVQVNPSAPCIEPAPLVSLSDYNGPLKKTVGLFARTLERKAVHPRITNLECSYAL